MTDSKTIEKIQTLEADMGMKVSKDSDIQNMTEKAVESYMKYLEENSRPANKASKPGVSRPGNK